MSDGAPYHHFEDKEALLAAVSADAFRRLHDEMTSAAARQRGSARKKSLAMGVAYVLFAARHPARFRLMFGPLLHTKRRNPELSAAAEGVRELVQQALEGGLESDGSPKPPHVPLCAFALLHGLAVLSIDGHLSPGNAAELERVAWQALELVAGRSADEPDEVPESEQRTRAGRSRPRTAAKR